MKCGIPGRQDDRRGRPDLSLSEDDSIEIRPGRTSKPLNPSPKGKDGILGREYPFHTRQRRTVEGEEGCEKISHGRRRGETTRLRRETSS
jgi:hypothetical protein